MGKSLIRKGLCISPCGATYRVSRCGARVCELGKGVADRLPAVAIAAATVEARRSAGRVSDRKRQAEIAKNPPKRGMQKLRPSMKPMKQIESLPDMEYFAALLENAADAGVPVVSSQTAEQLAKFAADAASDNGRAMKRANLKNRVAKRIEAVPAKIVAEYPRLIQLRAFENLTLALERAENAARSAFEAAPAE